MVPGKLSVILKLATPRRYLDPDYMRSIAAEIYGGAFRTDPELIANHARARLIQYGYSIERSFGVVFLNHSDEHVGDNCKSKERVAPLAKDEKQQKAAAHYCVEECEQIGAQNVEQTAARGLRNGVCEAERVSLFDLSGSHASLQQCVVIDG